MAEGGVIGTAEVVIRPNTKGFGKAVESGVSSPLGKLSGPLGKVTALFDKLGLSGASNMLGIASKAEGVGKALGELDSAGAKVGAGIEAGAAGADGALVTIEESAAGAAEQLSLLAGAGEEGAAGLSGTGAVAGGTAEQLSLLGAAGDEAAVGLTAAGAAGEAGAAGIEAEAVAAEGASAAFGLIAAAAGALIAVKLGSWALDGVGKFNDLAGEVRGFNRVAGTSAEDGSKMVFALKLLGISADTAGRGIFIMNKKIGDGSSKLDEFGVSIAKNRDGTTDLVGTILNVGDAYKAEADSGRRAALVQEAFGKGGKELIPILSKTREEIKQLFDEAAKTGHVLSPEDLQASIDYNRAQRDLAATTDKLSLAVGRELIPVLTGAAQAATGLADALNSVALEGADVGVHIPGIGTAIQSAFGLTPLGGITNFAAGLGAVGDAATKASAGSDKVAAAQAFLDENTKVYLALLADHKGKTAAAAEAQSNMAAAGKFLQTQQDKVNVALGGTSTKAQEAQTALTNLSNAVLGFGNAQRAQEQAIIDVGNAQAQLVTSIDAVTEARAKGRQDGETDAQFQARLAQLGRDVQTAYLGVANAQDAVVTATVAALTSQDAYTKAIQDPTARQKLIDQLIAAKNQYGDTTGAIQAQIDKLLAWNTFHPDPKPLDVPTAQANANIAVLQANIDGVHGKTIPITADTTEFVNKMGEVQRILSHLPGGSTRLKVIGGPVLGAKGIGIPGPVGKPFPMVAHGGELLLNASQVKAIGAGTSILANRSSVNGKAKGAGGGPVTVTLEQKFYGPTDLAGVRQANDELIPALTAALGQVG